MRLDMEVDDRQVLHEASPGPRRHRPPSIFTGATTTSTTYSTTITTKPARRAAGRAYPRSIWGLWIAIPILVISCLLELGLKITAPRLGSFDVPRDASVLVPGDRLVASAMRLWPAAVQKGEVMVPTVLAAVTLVEVLALGFFVVRVVRQNPVAIPLKGRITMLLAMAIVDIFGIATLGFVFIVNYKSARFDNAQAITQAEAARLASDNPNAGFGSAEFTYQGNGAFTTEAWACRVKELPGFDASFAGGLSRACGMEQAARYLLIVISVTLLAVFELVFRDKVDGTGLFAAPRYR